MRHPETHKAHLAAASQDLGKPQTATREPGAGLDLQCRGDGIRSGALCQLKLDFGARHDADLVWRRGREKGTFYFFLAKKFLLWQKRGMPRTARPSVEANCHRVINRSNAGQQVKDGKAGTLLIRRTNSVFPSRFVLS